MRLAQLLPHNIHPYSGLLHSVLGLSIPLARLGLHVELWQFAGADSLSTSRRGDLRRAGIESVEIPAASAWRLGRAGRHAIAARGVEFVHLHGVFSPLNNLAARTFDMPYALSPHGGYSPTALAHHHVRKLVFGRLLEQRMLRDAALVIALSDAERGDVRRLGYRGPIEVVPNGVEELPASAALPGSGLRQELGLAPAARLAVFVGRLDVRYKGLDALVAALLRAPEWQIALIGPDWQDGLRDLEALIRRLDLRTRVHLLPPRTGAALRQALEAADLFVLPSRSEGQSLALLQALSCGVPALVSPEVERTLAVARAGAGWVAERNVLPEALERLARVGPSEWIRRREAARTLASAFSWKRSALGYVAALARAGLGTS